MDASGASSGGDVVGIYIGVMVYAAAEVWMVASGSGECYDAGSSGAGSKSVVDVSLSGVGG